MQSGVILLSTYPDERTAVKAGKEIVRARLAACVTFTKVRSFYWWNGRIEDSNECIAMFKSVKERSKKLREAIVKSHPYKVPEIVELRMDSVSKSYLRWMVENVR
jgi:uncharacterized protein involved in tolerance to divalent cations